MQTQTSYLGSLPRTWACSRKRQSHFKPSRLLPPLPPSPSVSPSLSSLQRTTILRGIMYVLQRQFLSLPVTHFLDDRGVEGNGFDTTVGDVGENLIEHDVSEFGRIKQLTQHLPQKRNIYL
mmetsp:Transcript_18087/g.43247  ORF Transcript_18087/g.43247 Transcript_18087/m.43247 type:complete len:121 (-) Transcript_18087:175-537(-)